MLLVVLTVSLGKNDPLAVHLLLDMRLDEERHTAVGDLFQLSVLHIVVDMEGDVLRIAGAIDGGEGITGQDQRIGLVGRAVREVLAVERRLALGVGIDTQNHTAIRLVQGGCRLVVQIGKNRSQAILFLGHRQGGDAYIGVIQIDRASCVRLGECAGKICLYTVTQIFDLIAGLGHNGECLCLTGQKRETGEGRLASACDKDAHLVDHIHTLVGHGEVDRDIAVGGQRGIVHRGGDDFHSVLIEFRGAEEVHGLLGDAGGAGIGLAAQFIGVADLLELCIAVGRALQYGLDRFAVVTGDAGVHVIQPGAGGKFRHLNGCGGDVAAFIADKLDGPDHVVVLAAGVGVVPKEGQRVQRVRTLDKGELAVKGCGGDHVAERLRQDGLGCTILVEHPQAHIVLLRAGQGLDAGPTQNELIAHCGQLGVLVVVGVGGGADGLGVIFGFFRCGIHHSVVDVAAVLFIRDGEGHGGLAV